MRNTSCYCNWLRENNIPDQELTTNHNIISGKNIC
jgi:hypothetical protein